MVRPLFCVHKDLDITIMIVKLNLPGSEIFKWTRQATRAMHRI